MQLNNESLTAVKSYLADSANNSIYYELKDYVNPVSYTHLTLPTILLELVVDRVVSTISQVSFDCGERFVIQLHKI